MSLASGCPWRQDSRGELSRVRSIASGCRGPVISCLLYIKISANHCMILAMVVLELLVGHVRYQ